jgi:hypothetical protein
MSTPIAINEQNMEGIVTSTEDAVILDCVDRIGEITYREALDNYNNRMKSYIGFVNSIFATRINGVVQDK